MNIKRFNELMRAAEGRLGQSPSEWKCFLEFVSGYFESRNIKNPIVVEIGAMFNAQKSFYRELLDADHIGIDIKRETDIVADSRFPIALAAVRERLAGRPIDLLFIDGDHTYMGVKSDYEMYSPLTRHIIAIHDISHVYTPEIPEETKRFWQEISAAEKQYTHITIEHHNSMKTGITAGRQMGIGLIIKDGA